MSDSTDLVQHVPLVPVNTTTITDAEIDRMFRIAKALAMSGMFKDARQAEQAFAKIMLGRDLGLSPTQAMTGIYIVDGRPVVAAVTLAGFVKETPGCDYRVTEHTNSACSIEFFQEGESLGVSTFTMADAATAGLATKKNWRESPRNMLFARAMSNGVKWFVPHATRGIPVYHEGEIVPTAELTAGSGSGEPADVTLPAEVEAIIARAEALGHKAISDRGTAAFLAGQDPAKIEEWCQQSSAILDEFEAAQMADAERVE